MPSPRVPLHLRLSLSPWIRLCKCVSTILNPRVPNKQPEYKGLCLKCRTPVEPSLEFLHCSYPQAYTRVSFVVNHLLRHLIAPSQLLGSHPSFSVFLSQSSLASTQASRGVPSPPLTQSLTEPPLLACCPAAVTNACLQSNHQRVSVTGLSGSRQSCFICTIGHPATRTNRHLPGACHSAELIPELCLVRLIFWLPAISLCVCSPALGSRPH